MTETLNCGNINVCYHDGCRVGHSVWICSQSRESCSGMIPATCAVKLLALFTDGGKVLFMNRNVRNGARGGIC